MMQRRAVLKNMIELNIRERVGEFSEELKSCIKKDSDLGICKWAIRVVFPITSNK
jgi:hypothetical protein